MTDLGALGPPPPSVHPDAMLGPRSVAARLLGHPAVLLGGPRALLLQLAHPLVAAGVADHSDFHDAPFDRLLRTLSAMSTIAFSAPGRADAALEAVAATHRPVRGRAPDGRPYAAGDPRLAAWVHATLIDTALVVERRWLGRLTEGEQARFYRETLALARAFGVPDDGLPPDLAGFEAWMAAETAGLSVGERARAMGAEVLHPPLTRAWGPIGLPAERLAPPLLAAVTAELLPARLRRAYGLPEPGRPQRSALA
ncbi:MAG: oxygenase MpaB family protein, partial [Acidimicrobiales bacterium]